MDSKITKEQLKQVLSIDFDRLIEDVVEAINRAVSLITVKKLSVTRRGNFAAWYLKRLLSFAVTAKLFPRSGHPNETAPSLQEYRTVSSESK